MEFAVITARDRGRLVPAWQLKTRPAVIGELIVREQMNSHVRRHSRQATLIDWDTGMPCASLPPLWDAQLNFASQDHWILTGFEQITEDTGQPIDYAQTWILTPADRLTGADAIAYNRRKIAGRT